MSRFASIMKAVLFDMDGLLIDSEPLWQEAGMELLQQYGIDLTEEDYHTTMGLRTPEWLDHWFTHFNIPKDAILSAIKEIEENALGKITSRGIAMPGVESIFKFFVEKNFQIAIASSSPMRLINAVASMLQVDKYLQNKTSAEKLPYGKPHPQVFIECASALNISPSNCVVFEDSFNGMIAAKAAKMKCVIVPAPHVHHYTKWDAADLKLSRLDEFDDQKLYTLFPDLA